MTPPYLDGAASTFQRQSDVVLALPSGEERPAHSQFLARSCGLFADLLDACDAEGRPAAGAPLRVEVPATAAGTPALDLFLLCVYREDALPSVVGQLRRAADYGALLDLAAFARHARLLDALAAPLAGRTPELGALVGWHFADWLDVAERHRLETLRAYCLECMLHLLVAPGCTGRADEPPLAALELRSLQQEHLLLLLDGLTCGVRRCTRRTYEQRVWAPSTPGAPVRHLFGAAAAAPGPAQGPAMLALPQTQAPGTPGGGGRGQGSPLLGASAPGRLARPVGSPSTAPLTLQLPQLRREHIQAALPREAGILAWQRMGDLSSSEGS